MTDTASDLQREVDAFRSRLIRMDRQASQVLSATYADTLKALQPRLDALEANIASQIKAGGVVNQSWLFQQDRYQELIRQTNQLMTQYGATTKTVVTAAQQAAVRASLVEAGSQLAAVSGGSPEIARLSAGWASIPDSSIQNMVGALQDSTPLGQLLADFGKDAVQDVNRALLRGMALGLGAPESTRAVQMALGITRARAESIVRTETLRAANTALLAAYGESGVVKGWRWSAALSARTCAACLGRHGKVFPLKKPMDRHVNCRCSASPWLGNGDDAPWESGDAWLKRQPLPVQQGILGQEGSRLYRGGQLQLGNFGKFTPNKQWGGQWTDGGVSHAKRQAAKAGRPAAATQQEIESSPASSQAWSPSMNRKDADAWAVDSVVQDVVYHGTTPAAAKAITQSGFDLSRVAVGRLFGNGVYTGGQSVAQVYATRGGLLPLKLNIKNPLRMSKTEAYHLTDSPEAKAILERITLENALLKQEVANASPARAVEIEKYLASPKANPYPEAITEWAQGQGYDSLIIEDFSGADELAYIVFDAQDVVVVVK